MTNTLTDEEREKLAKLAGVERIKHGAYDGIKINGGIVIVCGTVLYWSDWLSGDLTSPESYHQAHLVLKGVREKFNQKEIMEFIGRLHPSPKQTEITCFEFLTKSPEAICRAALKLLEGE